MQTQIVLRIVAASGAQLVDLPQWLPGLVFGRHGDAGADAGAIASGADQPQLDPVACAAVGEVATSQRNNCGSAFTQFTTTSMSPSLS